MKETRDNLGREKGRGDTCALKLILGRIDGGRNIEAQLQREAAGRIRRDRGGPEG
jgi:hypothetical protein